MAKLVLSKVLNSTDFKYYFKHVHNISWIVCYLFVLTTVRYCTDMTEAVLARLWTWRLSLVVIRVAMGSLWPTAK